MYCNLQKTDNFIKSCSRQRVELGASIHDSDPVLGPILLQATKQTAFLELIYIFLDHLLSSFFFENLFRVFTVLAVSNLGFCVGPQNIIGHLARCHRRLIQVSELSAPKRMLLYIIIIKDISAVYRVHKFLSEGLKLCVY